MGTVGVRELSRNTSKILGEVAREERPMLVTKHGRPVAAIVPIDADALEDWILATAPEFVASLQEADEALAAGVTRPAKEVFAELSTDS